MTIDPGLLPESALLDTGVLIRALGDRPHDAVSPACVEFFKAMQETKRDILIAAPTFAELLRGRRGTPLPVMEGVTTVAFDGRAAELLGEAFPMDLLNEFKKKLGDPLAYYKYDAMIVASAERWGAKCIVALDDGVLRLAKERKLRGETPDAFRSKQGTLSLVTGTAEATPVNARKTRKHD